MSARPVSVVGKFLATVTEFDLLPEGTRVLAAVSGGPDSVCLLDLLLVVAPRLKLEVTAFHLNHRLRSAAARDEEFVREFCRSRKVELKVAHRNAAGFARRHGLGLEEAGRELRYHLLETTADRLSCGRIALGHTADDNLETMLMNICRGSGLRGVAGIPVRRGRVVRPLLDIERRDVVRYLSARDLDWVEDETNADIRFRRNFVRRQIVPLLRKVNLSAAANARRSARLLAAEDEYLDGLTRKALKRSVVVEPCRTVVDIRKLRQYNIVLLRRVVRTLRPELDAEGVDRLLEFMLRAGTGRVVAGLVELRRKNGTVEIVNRRKGRTRQSKCSEIDS